MASLTNFKTFSSLTLATYIDVMSEMGYLVLTTYDGNRINFYGIPDNEVEAGIPQVDDMVIYNSAEKLSQFDPIPQEEMRYLVQSVKALMFGTPLASAVLPYHRIPITLEYRNRVYSTAHPAMQDSADQVLLSEPETLSDAIITLYSQSEETREAFSQVQQLVASIVAGEISSIDLTSLGQPYYYDSSCSMLGKFLNDCHYYLVRCYGVAPMGELVGLPWEMARRDLLCFSVLPMPDDSLVFSGYSPVGINRIVPSAFS